MSDNSIRPKLSLEQRESLAQEWRERGFHSGYQESPKTTAGFEPRILSDTNETLRSITTARLLAEFAAIINNYGPYSPQSEEFLDQHAWDSELIELCETSRKLKAVLGNREPK